MFVLPGLRPHVVAGLGGSSNLAIAVTREGLHFARISEASQGALNARITAFRCQIALNEPSCSTAELALLRGVMVLDGPGTADGFDPAVAQALYRDLFGRIEPALAGKTHPVIVPPPDLLRLPFQALVTGTAIEEIPWMIRRHAISVLPSVPAWKALREAPPVVSDHLLAVGDPVLAAAVPADCTASGVAIARSSASLRPETMPNGAALAQPDQLRALPSLPDASCEINAIADAFAPAKAKLLLQGAAREGQIKALNAEGRLQDFGTLVFATHGLLAGEAGALEPRLALTPPAIATKADDGLLTASEIESLTLNARLLILSACNTAGGDGQDGDGLSGLTRAFFQAWATT